MINQQLFDYIKQRLQQGESRETINVALSQQGWQQQDIEQAFSQVFMAPMSVASALGQNEAKQEGVDGSGSANESEQAVLQQASAQAQPPLSDINLRPSASSAFQVPTSDVQESKPSVSIIAAVLIVLAVGVAAAFFFFKEQIMSFLPKGNQVKTETTSQPPAQSAKPDILEKQAYSNSQYGFKINAPKGWRVDEGGTMGTIVIFGNFQIDKEGENPFGANINITSESTQGLDLTGYVNATKDMLPKIVQDYKLTEEKSITVVGLEAKLIGATFTQGVYHVRNLQLIIVKDEQAYVVTATALESMWDQYKNTIESSLLTFKLEAQSAKSEIEAVYAKSADAVKAKDFDAFLATIAEPSKDFPDIGTAEGLAKAKQQFLSIVPSLEEMFVNFNLNKGQFISLDREDDRYFYFSRFDNLSDSSSLALLAIIAVKTDGGMKIVKIKSAEFEKKSDPQVNEAVLRAEIKRVKEKYTSEN